MITAILIIWYRDLLRFWRNRIRMVGSFIFPILWLLVFGLGLSASLTLPVPELKFVMFLYPGILAQFLIFTSMFSAITILQDREFGFLKEILVSPIPRSAVAIGKILGGATTGFINLLPVILLAPVVDVGLSWAMIAELIPALALLSLALSALGVAITSKLKSLESGQYVFQFIMFPLVMLSGAFFPLRNLPEWLNILTKLNPISYAVDLIRRIVMNHQDISRDVVDFLSPTIDGRVVSMGFEFAVVAYFTIALIILASYFFSRSD